MSTIHGVLPGTALMNCCTLATLPADSAVIEKPSLSLVICKSFGADPPFDTVKSPCTGAVAVMNGEKLPPPAPPGPVGPVPSGPVKPVGPVTPGPPAEPVGPVGPPSGPVGPIVPVAPVGPDGPATPGPVGPVRP